MRLFGTEARSGDLDADQPRYYERLRELPIEIATLIADDIGPRPPMSLGEAKTAALLDARLRRVGMRLSAESYRAPRLPGYDIGVIAILAALGVASFYWMPLPAIALFAVCLVLALLTLVYDETPLMARRAPSQNVTATRAAADELRWRLVLLAPLSSPPAVGRLMAGLGSGPFHRAILILAAAILLALGVATMLVSELGLRLLLWYGQIALTALLLFLGFAAFWLRRARATPGAVSYAGAVAVLAASAAQLTNLRHTELWVVGVGAADSRAGISDLLRRYPFDRRQTLFVGLAGIGDGELCYLAAEHTPRARLADALLLRLAARVVDAGQAHAHPRAYRGATLAGMLRRQGLRAIAVAGLDAHGNVPRQYESGDTITRLNAGKLDEAVRFVVALARTLDEEPAGG